MVKISSEQKEQEKITNDYKNTVLDSYSETLFITDKCIQLYESELKNMNKYVKNKMGDIINNENNL